MILCPRYIGREQVVGKLKSNLEKRREEKKDYEEKE
jgi:hypothetical protein